MRIKLPHAPYIARKVGLDLYNCGFVSFNGGIEPTINLIKDILEDDINKEKALEEKVKQVLEQNENEMDFMQVDRKNMFWLIKKRLAKDFGVILTYEDRYNHIAHEILELLWKKNFIDYKVSENRVKNIIYNAIKDYINSYEEIEDIVVDKLENYKRKLIPGTEEYDLVFEKLYEEELRKKGMI
ncbi:competence/damage-inducible domain-containing protein [Campylobacter hyointestinalis]|uniref:Competence protein n=1 Tax=Campylobacter hyointestinalis subsp. hyointestinalis TaxID=91352 RepID=A0A2S5J7Z5_CAMHY|nr:DUF507 family protein [Campylobacter hyointestinalis]ANE33047.1 putative DUF507 domain protein [Campylobacter hyointestinalis subsp. hyointestinalis LMG 9260]KEA43789.1 competence protein [Campylobacter hyointestinalis subsp. hyointestinalis]MBT0612080.1 DUF507 family protein [Campylobacter hyointestinalis subsp. hyointestinalis]MDL2346497.1 DUF507 family protein [Campylobacter hyointestinalis]MDL2348236.1 DUF507 family protein [Campylobacter hyointestinalis]